ncbi:MAG: SIS domain-containing protein [Leptolinea sp.]|jgi:uncharacterized phosphosugar-binding protein|nr:SIS domain-containing protein [Leptolinea sp.]
MNGIETYYSAILALEKRVIDGQITNLKRIASAMADTIADDKRIFVFGTGHSHLLIEEAFYRAGGLACVVPIFSSALMLHENPPLSSFLERNAGLAPLLLNPYHPQPGEMILIYSNSGVNTLPVEMALVSKEKGLSVVAICSKEYARVAPLSGIGKRLYEVADFEIDNGGVPGDAIVPVEGTQWKVSPSSTIINAMLWNCLLTETVFILQERGVDLPLIASMNMKGAAQHNQVVFEKWQKINPHL